MTTPLLMGTDGVRKMSKSLGNYIALEDPPGEMFGKIMSISDDLMQQYYELLTTADVAAISQIHPMEAKLRLAHEIVARYHGAGPADEARDSAPQFRGRAVPSDRKSTRLNSSHQIISYAVFCFNKERKNLIVESELTGAVEFGEIFQRVYVPAD